MLISPAYAQGTGGGGSGIFEMILPLILIFAVFYFLLIRPQQRKMKEHKSKVAAVRRGDRVVTGGGLIGTVAKVVDDNEVIVEIADGVRVKAVRSTLSDVIAKTGPADSRTSEAEDEEGGVAKMKGRIRKVARRSK